MLRRASCFAATIWLLSVPRLGAQRPLGSERSDVAHLAGDVWAVLTSPVHATNGGALPALAALVTAFDVATHVDSATWHWMTTHDSTLAMRALEPMRDHWKLPLYEMGSGQGLWPVFGTMYAAGRLRDNADLRDAGMGCLAAHLSSAAARDVIYLTVGRARPHVTTNPDSVVVPGTKDWNRHSFLGGHVANSMGCASFLAHRYNLGLVQVGAYAYVAAIAVGRMADGWHWTSDTIAGAAMGYAIGKYVAQRQEDRIASQTPAAAIRRTTIPIGWSFSF